MYLGLHVKYSFFMIDFSQTSLFSTGFRKILKYKILRKSLQWESNYSVRTDGETDRKTNMKLIFAFRNFENAPKNTQHTQR